MDEHELVMDIVTLRRQLEQAERERDEAIRTQSAGLHAKGMQHMDERRQLSAENRLLKARIKELEKR